MRKAVSEAEAEALPNRTVRVMTNQYVTSQYLRQPERRHRLDGSLKIVLYLILVVFVFCASIAIISPFEKSRLVSCAQCNVIRLGRPSSP